MREVVVTGLGLVTPLGVGTEINWNRLISSHIGINKIENCCAPNCFDFVRVNCCAVNRQQSPPHI